MIGPLDLHDVVAHEAVEALVAGVVVVDLVVAAAVVGPDSQEPVAVAVDRGAEVVVAAAVLHGDVVVLVVVVVVVVVVFHVVAVALVVHGCHQFVRVHRGCQDYRDYQD